MLDEQRGVIDLTVIDGVMGSADVEFREPIAGRRGRNRTGLDRGLEDVGSGGRRTTRLGTTSCSMTGSAV